MARRAEQGRDRRLLDLLSGVHHHDPLGDLGDDAEVVGDEHDRGPDPTLEIPHQVEDLRLDGHVERRRRLVGDEQLRVAGERHRDHHPLAHAARELVRILAKAPARLRDADEVQHLDGAVLRRPPLEAFVQAQRLAQLASDRQHRVEAGHRLLEDHADVVAADVAHRALGQRQEIAALEPDRAGDLAGRLGDEAQDRVRGDGLAAAALADDRQRLAFLDLEGDAVDGAVDAVRGPEMGLQILDVEQRHRSRSPLPCADRGRRAARRRGDSRRAPSRRGRSPG